MCEMPFMKKSHFKEVMGVGGALHPSFFFFCSSSILSGESYNFQAAPAMSSPVAQEACRDVPNPRARCREICPVAGTVGLSQWQPSWGGGGL